MRCFQCGNNAEYKVTEKRDAVTRIRFICHKDLHNKDNKKKEWQVEQI